MLIKLGSKRFGDVQSKPFLGIEINKKCFDIHFKGFNIFYHGIDKYWDKPCFQFNIGYTRCFDGFGLININTAYLSKKHIFGLPVQRFLNYNYFVHSDNNETISEYEGK